MTLPDTWTCQVRQGQGACITAKDYAAVTPMQVWAIGRGVLAVEVQRAWE